MNTLIDLSYPLCNGMPCYPGDPEIMLKQAKDDRTKVTEISFGSHTATHVDVPSHLLENGKTLGDMDLLSFFGQAVKLSLKNYMKYDPQEFKYDGIILETGWGEYYRDNEKYFGNTRPSIPLSLAESLSATGLKFFGCDLPSVDKSGAKEKIIHQKFLSKNIVIYENLANLEKLPEGAPFTFIGFPLNIPGIDGSPVRAIAVLKDV
ncbi:MAG: cyclase family protein [Desulfobacterales bacterium]|nr:cyclase family protein [Desulfobacterales bacterium]